MLKNGVFLGQRYEIISRIGSGGMADVYKARDHKLNRFVAIKVLKKEFRVDSKFVSKFRVEAQSAAGLIHPNIVGVYDVADEQGISYMVMELVEGITLKDYIEKRGQLSSKEAISISIQVANGIECAHKNHIVHRDIKPQNIIISREGKVKVTDFGIARAASVNTISSNAMGSVHYTSPEQARGGYSDFKSDIYSLGITMYEMLAGRVPFDGDSTVTIAIKHLQEEMELPSKYAPDMPYSLEQIILKCCQKSPDRRYSGMTELIQDLKQSLINPEGDFVKIPASAGSETVLFNPEEMEELRNSYRDASKSSGRNFGDYDDEDDFVKDRDDYYDDGYEDRYEKHYDNRKNPRYDTRYGSRYDDRYDEKRSRHDRYDSKYDKYSNFDEDEDDYDDFRDEYRKGVNPGMERIMKILMVVAAIIMGVLIIFFVGKAIGIFKFGPSIPAISFNDEGDIEVPSFLGMSLEEAQAEAESRGLVVEQVATEESEQYDVGLVTKQDVAAKKKVKEGKKISLTISSGLIGTNQIVPSVLGYTQEEAEKTLTGAGFKVESNFEPSSTVPSGSVINQTPAPNIKAGKNATVTIVVSTGSDSTKVPTVTGLSLEEAKQRLNGAGLSVGTVTEQVSEQDKGKVITQGTVAETEVAKGSAISLIVSKGDVPLEEQTWECNAKITLPPSYNGELVKVVLTQGSFESIVLDGEPIENPYVLKTKGKPGVESGTINIYHLEKKEDGTEEWTELGNTTVTFSRVNSISVETN